MNPSPLPRGGVGSTSPPGASIVVIVVIVIGEEDPVARVTDLSKIGFGRRGGVGDERETVRIAAKLRLLAGRPGDSGTCFHEETREAVLGIADLDLARRAAPVDFIGDGGGNPRP